MKNCIIFDCYNHVFYCVTLSYLWTADKPALVYWLHSVVASPVVKLHSHPGSDALISTLHTFFPSSSHFPPRCLLLAAAGTPPVAQTSLRQGRADKTPLNKGGTAHLCLTLTPLSLCNCCKGFCTGSDQMCHDVTEFVFLSLAEWAVSVHCMSWEMIYTLFFSVK